MSPEFSTSPVLGEDWVILPLSTVMEDLPEGVLYTCITQGNAGDPSLNWTEVWVTKEDAPKVQEHVREAAFLRELSNLAWTTAQNLQADDPAGDVYPDIAKALLEHIREYDPQIIDVRPDAIQRRADALRAKLREERGSLPTERELAEQQASTMRSFMEAEDGDPQEAAQKALVEDPEDSMGFIRKEQVARVIWVACGYGRTEKSWENLPRNARDLYYRQADAVIKWYEVNEHYPVNN